MHALSSFSSLGTSLSFSLARSAPSHLSAPGAMAQYCIGPSGLPLPATIDVSKGQYDEISVSKSWLAVYTKIGRSVSLMTISALLIHGSLLPIWHRYDVEVALHISLGLGADLLPEVT